MNDIVKQDKIYGFSLEKIKTIKSLLGGDLTESELSIFLYNCQRFSLDPIAKQIYAIKRNGRMTIQTGIDGFRAIADRTGKYAPGKATHYQIENGHLISATAYVKKLTADGTWHEVSETAFNHEYNPYLKANPPKFDSVWKTLPSVMLAKCAEARALRRAFPESLGGIYTDDEMDQADCTITITPPHKEEDNIDKDQTDVLIDLYNLLGDDKKAIAFRALKELGVNRFDALPVKHFDGFAKFLSSLKDQEREEFSKEVSDDV